MQNAVVKSFRPLLVVPVVVLFLQAARAGEGWMFDPDFRAGRPSDVTRPGWRLSPQGAAAAVPAPSGAAR